MPYHDHSHPDGEVCEHTPIDIDADLEHDHRFHNHMHHNLHQHVSNEISTASSLSAANQNCRSNAKPHQTCVPCAYDVRPTNALMVPDTKVDAANSDEVTPVSVVVTDSHEKNEVTTVNSVVKELKSK